MVVKEKIKYLCPGTNPSHYAFKLKPKTPCTLDYEHGVEGGSRTRTTFKCDTNPRELDPTFPEEKMHDCSIDMPYDVYGPAIEVCTADYLGRLWVSNGEYSTMVKYCPECGVKGEL